MTDRNIYIHLDGETATLKAHTGKMFAIGAVATFSDYSLHPELAHQFYTHKIPDYSLWDQDALTWAMKAYGADNYISRAIELHEHEFDWRKIWSYLIDNFEAWLEPYKRAGYTLNIICNHTNFDVTFLQAIYDKMSRKFPFKYDKVWDMPSMILATVKTPLNAAYSSAGFTKEEVAHLALNDAIRQASMMAHYNVYLPE